MNSLKKVLAGILSGFMVISTVSQVQPPVLAQETTQSSESEGTKAKTRNIEVRQNSAFDIETDFQAIENLKDLDASVSLKQAENKEGQPFDIHTPGVYMAVYEISPRNGEASYEAEADITVVPDNSESDEALPDTETPGASGEQNPEAGNESSDIEEGSVENPEQTSDGNESEETPADKNETGQPEVEQTSDSED